MKGKLKIYAILIAGLLSLLTTYLITQKSKIRHEGETRWLAYRRNGDKPDIEFEITERRDKTDGHLIIHDVINKSEVVRIPLEIRRISRNEYRAMLKIDVQTEELRITYSESSDGLTRTALIQNADGSDEPTIYEFKLVTNR